MGMIFLMKVLVTALANINLDPSQTEETVSKSIIMWTVWTVLSPIFVTFWFFLGYTISEFKGIVKRKIDVKVLRTKK
jgi:hypothetical protein